MPLLKRCVKILKQGVYLILSPAEDPRRHFPTLQDRPNHLLQQVESALIETHTLIQQLVDRKTALEKHLPPLRTKARQALQAGHEDLARLALQRRQAAIREIESIDRQLEEARGEERRLQRVRHQIENQIEAMQARQQVISARYSAAEAQVRLNESLSGVAASFSDLGISLEEAQQQAEQMQARAGAVQDLMETGVLEIPQAGDFTAEWGRFDDSQAVEDQLAALKREVQTSDLVA